MSNSDRNPSKQSGKYIAGFILMAVGLVMLLKQLDLFFFPSWIFSWPMILIIVGLVKKGNNRSKNSSWLILIVVGCLFLLEQIFPGTHIVRHCWPLIIIAAGLWMVFYRKHDLGDNIFSKEAYVNPDFLNPDPAKAEPQNTTSQTKPESSEDYLSAFSIFGNVRKNIMSKTFKGGEIVNVFGGTDLDFSHADLSGQVVIDLMQLFGGTKLIIPPHWQVVSDVAAIFGGVNDKRIPHADVAAGSKVLVLKGISIFGGVDIKSF